MPSGRPAWAGRAAPVLAFVLCFLLTPALPAATAGNTTSRRPQPSTATPIKHLVVLFQENVSFDHYFSTYPHAANLPGEPRFHARPSRPSVNGLRNALRLHNPNAANPQRLARSEALTCDQGHGYTQEQRAFDGGLMDRFVEFTNRESCAPPAVSKPNLAMDYYDGNTVTALWNYAQHFAMSDNSYGTVFGPSTPGALNLVSGQTHGAISTIPARLTVGVVSPDANGVGTVINDPDPTFDDCSTTRLPTVSMVDDNKNVGDLLNARHVTWGFFAGGFRPSSVVDGRAICATTQTNIGGVAVRSYIPHHQPFQYYRSTANPHHLPPSSSDRIGYDDTANHQYDLIDFWAAVESGNLPAVSYLKAPAAQDGHAGYSDPLDEQAFLVDTINRLQRTPEWKHMAIVILYDDSDGWYDHVMGPIVSPSADPARDALTAGGCGTPAPGAYADRCGYGPRQPLLVISPWARANFVDHSVTDQTSVLRFIEDNWSLGRIGDQSFDEKAGPLDAMFDFHAPNMRRLILDPQLGTVGSGSEADDG